MVKRWIRHTADLSKATKYLNYQHLQHHHVNPALYPEDAVYFQAPPSIFEEYRAAIISIFIVILSIFVAGLVWLGLYIQRQKQLDKELTLSSKYRRLVENMPVIYVRKKVLKEGAET